MAIALPMSEASDKSETMQLVHQAAAGNQEAWTLLLQRYRPRLRKMVALRIDRRLQGRIDPSDILQEGAIAAAKRLPDYAADPVMPFYLWLRTLTGQKLLDQHRRHLGAQARGATREISLYHGAFPETTIAALANQLLGKHSSPSSDAIRIERKIKLQEALNTLEPIDREILALRHFEQLTNGEAAEALGLDKSAASKRYMRALARLKDVLLLKPGDFDEH
jgi:RNA polymerase sigma-70 factor (ECF subfamily)